MISKVVGESHILVGTFTAEKSKELVFCPIVKFGYCWKEWQNKNEVNKTVLNNND